MSVVKFRYILVGLILVLFAGWPAMAQATVVRMTTSLGIIDIKLYDEQAPQTVTNFLNYVNRGAYNSTFIHRSIPDFVIQGGGYGLNLETGNLVQVITDPPVVNEYSPGRSNLRGTIAMAKLGSDPNSATSQWFFNLGDNSANLNYQNGGFTVFGEVIGNGMQTVDAIAALQTVSVGSGLFTNLPLVDIPDNGQINSRHLVLLQQVTLLPTSGAPESDRLFNYLEAIYPQFLAPASAVSSTASGYYYRFYPGTNAYIGTRDEAVYYLGSAFNNTLTNLGSLNEWFAAAQAAGY